jgi:hypothetical protein
VYACVYYMDTLHGGYCSFASTYLAREQTNFFVPLRLRDEDRDGLTSDAQTCQPTCIACQSSPRGGVYRLVILATFSRDLPTCDCACLGYRQRQAHATWLSKRVLRRPWRGDLGYTAISFTLAPDVLLIACQRFASAGRRASGARKRRKHTGSASSQDQRSRVAGRPLAHLAALPRTKACWCYVLNIPAVQS